MKSHALFCSLALIALLVVGSFAGIANAQVVLNFDYPTFGNEEGVNNYFNGGNGADNGFYSGPVAGPGPNYGVTFGSDAIVLPNYPYPGSNTSSANLGPTATASMIFLSGPGDIMNVSGGITTGFSFYYSSINVPGSVTVWSGPDATGIALATLVLPTTPTSYPTEPWFSPFLPAGVSFAGTAMSVDFSGTANQIAFDDITLGSASPMTSPVPEPSRIASLSGLLAIGLLGFVWQRRRRA